MVDGRICHRRHPLGLDRRSSQPSIRLIPSISLAISSEVHYHAANTTLSYSPPNTRKPILTRPAHVPCIGRRGYIIFHVFRGGGLFSPKPFFLRLPHFGGKIYRTFPPT